MDNITETEAKDSLWHNRKKSSPGLLQVDNNFYPEAKPNVKSFKEELSFHVNGLDIRVMKAGEEYKALFPLPEVHPYHISPETYFAEVNFLPKNHQSFESKNLSVALASILTGMQKFFELYPNDEKGVWGKPLPDYFYGHTNKRMATFAKNFGFDVTEYPEKNTNIVIGEFKKVKESFKKLTEEKPELIEGLIKRAVREEEMK